MKAAAPTKTSRWHPDGARRDVVAKHAARLFAERGYHGASLRDIASASGIQSPSLYSHYPSKLSIFVEVVTRYFDTFLPRIADAAGGPGDGAQRVRTMLIVSVEVGVELKDEFLTTSNNWEWIRATPELNELRQRRDDALGWWSVALTGGIADGSLRDVDVPSTLWIISSAVTGMVDRRYADTVGSVEPPPIDTLLDVVLNGLATQRSH